MFDILEDDGKGSYTSVPRDKTCFKIRRDVHKQINIQLHQLSNRLLIIERLEQANSKQGGSEDNRQLQLQTKFLSRQKEHQYHS